MRPFMELGALVEDQWRDENYDDNVLPGIAAKALREADLAARVDPWEIIRWVHTTTDLPWQKDSTAKFGEPPITLFAGQRFRIDVYYWLDGTTSIHQHAFSGAFQVLLGGSLHSHYAFQMKHEINPHLLVGDILLEGVSLLGKGDIKRDPFRIAIYSFSLSSGKTLRDDRRQKQSYANRGGAIPVSKAPSCHQSIL